MLNFAFVGLAWGDLSKNILLRSFSKSLLPVFSRSFMFSVLTFKSWIHLNFCIWCYTLSSFIVLHEAVQFSNTFYWRNCLFPLYILVCFLCHRLIDCIYTWVYFWALYSIQLICFSVWGPVPYWLITIVLYYSLKSGHMIPSVLFVLFQDCFGYSRSFVVPCNF